MIGSSGENPIIKSNIQQLADIKSSVKTSHPEDKTVSTVFIDTLTGELSSVINSKGITRNRWKMVDVEVNKSNITVAKEGLTEQAITVVDATIDLMKKQSPTTSG